MSYVKVLLANKLIALIDSRMNKKLLPHQTVATAFIHEEEIPKLELLLFLLFVIFDSTATTIFKRTTASDSESKKTYFAPPQRATKLY